MPTQDSVLGPISGNKRKKKATERVGDAHVQPRRTGTYNAALELAIEEENENAGYTQSSEKEDEDHYDLAMEEPPTEPDSTIEDNPPSHCIDVRYLPPTHLHQPSPEFYQRSNRP